MPTPRPIRPLGLGKPTARVCTTVDRGLAHHLRDLAEANATTIADVAREALCQFVLEHVDPGAGEPGNLRSPAGPTETLIEAGGSFRGLVSMHAADASGQAETGGSAMMQSVTTDESWSLEVSRVRSDPGEATVVAGEDAVVLVDALLELGDDPEDDVLPA